MIKAILLEVYLPVVSSHGLQLTSDPLPLIPHCSSSQQLRRRRLLGGIRGEGVWNRLSAAISHLELLGGGTVRPQTNCINNFKVKSRQSKGILIQNIGTSRLPKAGNGYGNRGIVVPGYANIYCPMKIGTRGRIPDFNIRELSTSAGSPVQRKSDTCAKLLKLREHCMKNPDTPVNLEKIYRLMYDPSLYELAYNKLKSNPGNMTAGITPTTLDGMSMEVIERIIEKLKDNSFKFSPWKKSRNSQSQRWYKTFNYCSPRDKLVQEVMRMILEAIFEPTFSDNSHGFRPGRSCHTALKKIKERFGVAT